MEKTTTPRITKAMRYADIKALLTGKTPENGSTVEDALAFIDAQVDLLAKKNSSGSKKPTAKQTENEEYKRDIMEFLQEQTEPVTCTTIQKSVPALVTFNNQKVAALLRLLKDAGLVEKTKGKGGVPLFAAVADADAE